MQLQLFPELGVLLLLILMSNQLSDFERVVALSRKSWKINIG